MRLKLQAIKRGVYEKRVQLGLLLFMVVVLGLFALGVLSQGQLVYGDIPYFRVGQSNVNFLYSWGQGQFGTNVRQGLNTLRDATVLSVIHSSTSYYYAKYLMPILLIPLSYYLCLSKLGIKNRWVKLLASMLPVASPVFFGDFLTGQTMWVYPLLPWTLFYALKIFLFREASHRNGVLLGLFIFLTFGMLPPIIIPLGIILGLLSATGWIAGNHSEGKEFISIIKASAIAALTFILLAAPYILIASSGQKAFTPPSILGDYFNNYSATSFANVLRLAGNAGNGQQTLGYNAAAASNAAGYILLAVIIGGLMVKKKVGMLASQADAIITLMITSLSIFLFLNVMAKNVAFGAKVFQSQWLVSTIRNPTKVYVILLAVFTLLFAYCLSWLLASIRSKVYFVVLLSAVVLALGIYGWPLLRGDFGLFYGKGKAVSNYKPDKLDADIADEANASTDGRAILIPANHHDELNYQDLAPSLNTLGLEGGLPASVALINEIKTAWLDQNQYFFNYLAAGGISDIFLKKIDTYHPSIFDLFYSPYSYKQAAEFIKPFTLWSKDRPGYTHFHLGANPLVFSPTDIKYVEGTNGLKAEAPFLHTSSAVLEILPSGADQKYYDHLLWSQNLKSKQAVSSGVAQLFDPTLVLVGHSVNDKNGVKRLLLSIKNPLTGENINVSERNLEQKDNVLSIDGQYELLDSMDNQIGLKSGNHALVAGSLAPVGSAIYDPGFESDQPVVGDASNRRPGNAHVYSSRSAEHTQGSYSQLLGSKNHLAFTYKLLDIADKSKEYKLSFDTKSLRGTPLAYIVLQGSNVLATSNGPIEQKQGWQTVSSFFRPDTTSNPITIFFYTDSTGQTSENLIDNLVLERVDEHSLGSITLPSYPPDYVLTNYTAPTTPLPPHNLLNDPSFEASTWGGVGDATVSAPGEAIISAGRVHDGFDGKYSLQLKATRHTAFVSQAVTQFNPNAVYKVSLAYKHIKGSSPYFSLWQPGVNKTALTGTLRSSGSDWETYEGYFVPDKGAKNLILFLYSPSIEGATANRFDDVSITTTPLISDYITSKTTAINRPINLVKSYRITDPTYLEVHGNGGPGMLVLNESFHRGWRAFIASKDYKTNMWTRLLPIKPGRQIPEKNHVIVNGFANGWWLQTAELPKENYTIVLEYWPQKLMYTGFAISGLAALGVIIFLLATQRRKEGQSQG